MLQKNETLIFNEDDEIRQFKLYYGMLVLKVICLLIFASPIIIETLKCFFHVLSSLFKRLHELRKPKPKGILKDSRSPDEKPKGILKKIFKFHSSHNEEHWSSLAEESNDADLDNDRLKSKFESIKSEVQTLKTSNDLASSNIYYKNRRSHSLSSMSDVSLLKLETLNKRVAWNVIEENTKSRNTLANIEVDKPLKRITERKAESVIKFDGLFKELLDKKVVKDRSDFTRLIDLIQNARHTHDDSSSSSKNSINVEELNDKKTKKAKT